VKHNDAVIIGGVIGAGHLLLPLKVVIQRGVFFSRNIRIIKYNKAYAC